MTCRRLKASSWLVSATARSVASRALQIVARGMLCLEIVERKLRATADDGEQIVEVVSDAARELTECIEPLRVLQASLHGALLAHVSKYEDHAGGDPTVLRDRGAAVGDGPPRAVPGDQERVVGQPHDPSRAQHLGDRVLDGELRRLADDVEDLLQAAAFGLLQTPPRQPFSDGIQEADGAAGVDRQHGIANRAQGGGQPAPTLLESRPAQALLTAMVRLDHGGEGEKERAEAEGQANLLERRRFERYGHQVKQQRLRCAQPQRDAERQHGERHHQQQRHEDDDLRVDRRRPADGQVPAKQQQSHGELERAETIQRVRAERCRKRQPRCRSKYRCRRRVPRIEQMGYDPEGENQQAGQRDEQ